MALSSSPSEEELMTMMMAVGVPEIGDDEKEKVTRVVRPEIPFWAPEPKPPTAEELEELMYVGFSFDPYSRRAVQLAAAHAEASSHAGKHSEAAADGDAKTKSREDDKATLFFKKRRFDSRVAAAWQAMDRLDDNIFGSNTAATSEIRLMRLRQFVHDVTRATQLTAESDEDEVDTEPEKDEEENENENENEDHESAQPPRKSLLDPPTIASKEGEEGQTKGKKRASALQLSSSDDDDDDETETENTKEKVSNPLVDVATEQEHPPTTRSISSSSSDSSSSSSSATSSNVKSGRKHKTDHQTLTTRGTVEDDEEEEVAVEKKSKKKTEKKTEKKKKTVADDPISKNEGEKETPSGSDTIIHSSDAPSQLRENDPLKKKTSPAQQNSDAAPSTSTQQAVDKANEDAPKSALAALVHFARKRYGGQPTPSAQSRVGKGNSLASMNKLNNPADDSEDNSSSSSGSDDDDDDSDAQPRKQMRKEETTSSDDDDDDDEFGVVIPEMHTNSSNMAETARTVPLEQPTSGLLSSVANHPSQMTREEFQAQFKRPPRRGELGASADEIEKAESLGYVMSGSRSRGVQRYVDSVQKQLHEKETAKLKMQLMREQEERNAKAAMQATLEVLKNSHSKHDDS